MMTMVGAVAFFVTGFIFGIVTVALLMANDEKEQKGEDEPWED